MKITFYGYCRMALGLLFLALTTSLFAQNASQGHIEGHVLDAITGKPLAKAEVSILPGTATAQTMKN